jgi:phage-related protein
MTKNCRVSGMVRERGKENSIQEGGRFQRKWTLEIRDIGKGKVKRYGKT